MPSKKTPTPDPRLLAEAARVCACFNFRKASRAVTQLFDAVLHAGGLRSTQFVILVAVSLDKVARLPDLARVLNLDRSTLTRNLQPLVREGLRNVAAGANPMVLKKGIESAVATAVDSIKATSQKVETDKAQIANVAAISAADTSSLKTMFGSSFQSAWRSIGRAETAGVVLRTTSPIPNPSPAGTCR